MDIDARLQLIKEVGEEILTEEELKQLLETKQHPVAYDGFEPSGTSIHIAQGLLRAININKMTQAGVKFTMLTADWHAWANNKLGGDLQKIQTTGKYFVEVWKQCGLDLDKVNFISCKDLMEKESYWKTVMQISRNNTVQRILRCSQIMGRSEKDTLQASQILYPCMQCADIFEIGADITQLGMDQRKVNVLAREIGEKIGFWKPVVVSHHMLQGLGDPPQAGTAEERALAMKMSKSNPNSAIFMTDTEEEIKRKINKAHCPEKVVEHNPILEYNKYIVFQHEKEVTVERPAKFGGNVTYTSYAELEQAFVSGLLHPMDLKAMTAHSINSFIEPVRLHFQKNAHARKLFEEVQTFQVTR